MAASLTTYQVIDIDAGSAPTHVLTNVFNTLTDLHIACGGDHIEFIHEGGGSVQIKATGSKESIEVFYRNLASAVQEKGIE